MKRITSSQVRLYAGVVCLLGLTACSSGGGGSSSTPTQTAPVITTQPTGQTVTAPSTATFTVVATGNPTPTYQWDLNGAAIQGATSATYTTPATTTAMSGGSYTCEVANSDGSVTSAAVTLTVNPAVSAPPGATFAGSVNDGTKSIPCTWTDGSRTNLAGDGTHAAMAFSPVVVAGSSILVPGFYNDGTKNIACTWNNGVRTDLAGGGLATDSSFALAIAEDGGTVYTAGYYSDSSATPTKNVPCYWNGSSRVDLPCTATQGYAFGIAVSGGTVYCAGSYYSGSGDVPQLWTNTAPTNLPGLLTPSVGDATSVIVSGSTVIVGGMVGNGTEDVPCIWTGTTLSTLPMVGPAVGGQVCALAMVDGTLYAGGNLWSSGLDVPCWWSGGVCTTLPVITNGLVEAIQVVQGSVICAGYYTTSNDVTTPCLWQSGDRTDLPMLGTNGGEVVCGWWVLD